MNEFLNCSSTFMNVESDCKVSVKIMIAIWTEECLNFIFGSLRNNFSASWLCLNGQYLFVKQ